MTVSVQPFLKVSLAAIALAGNCIVCPIALPTALAADNRVGLVADGCGDIGPMAAPRGQVTGDHGHPASGCPMRERSVESAGAGLNATERVAANAGFAEVQSENGGAPAVCPGERVPDNALQLGQADKSPPLTGTTIKKE